MSEVVSVWSKVMGLKIHYIFVLFLSLLFVFLLSSGVYAAVKINEVTIETGMQQIELLNDGSAEADISNWYLDDSGGSTYATIPSNTILLPNACYVYSGDVNLNKTSADTVRLFDSTVPPTSSSASIKDSYSYSKAPSIGLSFSRLPDGGDVWIATSSSIGFFNVNPTISCIRTLPTSTPTNTPSPTPTLTPTPYPNLILSEIYPYPLSTEKEWVEIYNPNTVQVSVEGWNVDDGENAGSSPQKLSGSISPLSFLSFELNVSLYNNDGDVVRLLNPEGKEVAKTSYSDIGQSQSWSLQKNGNDYCQTLATKNVVNSECIPHETPTPTASQPNVEPSPQPDALVLGATTQEDAFDGQQEETAPPEDPLSWSEIHESHSENNLYSETSVSQMGTINTKIVEDNMENRSTPEQTALLKSLSFSSFSFSLISLLSLVLKIKSVA